MDDYEHHAAHNPEAPNSAHGRDPNAGRGAGVATEAHRQQRGTKNTTRNSQESDAPSRHHEQAPPPGNAYAPKQYGER